MSLFDIKNKLYKKEPAEDLFKHGVSQYDPGVQKERIEISKEEDLWLEKKSGFGVSEKKAIRKGMLALGVILGIIFIMLITFEVRRVVFNSDSSAVSIAGPNQADSGHLMTYEITYNNGNWVNVKNAKLKITYPDYFQPELQANFKEENPTSGIYDLGTLTAKGTGKVVFSGRAYSPKGALIYLKAELSYQPAGFSGEFNTSNQLGVNIVPAPLVLEIQGPQKLTSGDAIDYVVTCKNDGKEVMDDLQLNLSYPDSFIFASATPPAEKDNNSWKIGSLKSGETEKIVISGKMDGQNGTTKVASVSVGVVRGEKLLSYNNESFSTQLVTSPLIVSQTVNDKQTLNVNAGDTLSFRIKYRNSGSIGLRDVIMTEKLDSSVLEYASLDMRGGNFDAVNNLISWKASDIKDFKNLSPGQGGEINFLIKLKSNIPLTDDNKKNFVISSLASIDSPDIPTPISSNKIISSNQMNIKVNSKMLLEESGFYNDMTIANTGPIPPRVGQETTYTIHWKVRNVSNDISNAQVSASLPTNAVMTGKFFPENARVNYNERTNALIWDIGKIDAGKGILNDPLEVAFQVKIKPSPDQSRKEVGILGISTFSADDLFTGEHLSVASEAKDTNLSEDKELMKMEGGRVAN